MRAVAVVLCAGACAGAGDDIGREPGEPLRDLTEVELGRFLLGKAVFERLTTAEEGLGPLYNEKRCSSCHDHPASGGSSTKLVTKATRFEGGVCDLLVNQGGDNIQQVATPLLVAHGILREVIPASATDSARVIGPPLFGSGLVETIADETILALEDPDDADGNGISGRVGRTADGRVGRFSRKSDVATVFDFIETALRFELGLTTPMNPMEETVNGVALPPDVDPMSDPEIDERGMGILTDFVRFLAPPAREYLFPAAADSVADGERLFEEVRCASCHVPSLSSGPNEVAALAGQTVHLYSDLLIHDMGPALGDVCGPNAEPSEYQTARLWGLRHRERFLHDGRATNVRDAILTHDGEGAGARDAFAALTPDEQQLLLRFLASL
ncbi:MAG: hypothetical protein O7I93_03050 [Gemmatimonadetes bacterium]|nr:hypothetical protein [Gemmatimonadota bacterium]